MLIVDVSEVKLPSVAIQKNLPPEYGQPIDGGETLLPMVIAAREGVPCSYGVDYETFLDALVWLQQNIQVRDRVATLTD
jgi:hypothetical protein